MQIGDLLIATKLKKKKTSYKICFNQIRWKVGKADYNPTKDSIWAVFVLKQ